MSTYCFIYSQFTGQIEPAPKSFFFSLNVPNSQGGQIGRFFANWATFGGLLDEVAQRNGEIWVYFLLQQIYYMFTKINSFKTRFVVGILSFNSGLMLIFGAFRLSIVVDILAFFAIETLGLLF